MKFFIAHFLSTALFALISCSSFHLLAQANVGINTTTPLAGLHVKDKDVLFSFEGNHVILGPLPPVSGAGTRLMWYASKGAFRAGRVDGTQWNRENVGLFSTAFGINNIARGVASFATGQQTEARGLGSMSVGIGTLAKMDGSLTIGTFNDTAAGVLFFQNSVVVIDPVFMIGNGTADNARSNALSVFKNGQTGINQPFPRAYLDIKFPASLFSMPHLKLSGNTNNGVSFLFDEIENLVIKQETVDGSLLPNINGGQFIFRNATNANLLSFSRDGRYTLQEPTGKTLMKVLPTGRVGINLAEPVADLHITHSTSDLSDRMVHLERNFLQQAQILLNDNLIFKNFGTLNGGGFEFQNTNGAFLVKISSGGSLNLRGEVNTTNSGTANLVPLVYGSVASDGSIVSGTGNFSVTQNATGQYIITLPPGFSYSTGGYSTLVTPVCGAGIVRIATTSSDGAGKLIVRIYNMSSTLTSNTFHFMIYTP